ncbi:MAG TPA: ribonuclease HII [Gammaproteobacteria bacterium]|nr:ribonuclease HII [Gammaproteobacteria bacterium]
MHELNLDLSPYRLIAGVDEAGRGPLVGAVVAAAVILDPARPVSGLRDSKKLSEKQRERLFPEITEKALAWAIASASAVEIDQINILQASLLAMQRAVEALALSPDIALVDGNRCPKLACRVEAIVKGDSKVEAISAASILAKVERDRQMVALHALYPQYGFNQHKGYPTAAHMALLKQFGPCAEHRRSFGPVRELL